MSNETKKYAGIESLQTFLEGCKNLFEKIGHKHTLSDIEDYTVDTKLSSTSNNPIANSAVDAEFEAISDAMGALETAIDSKADASHTHSNYATTSYVDTTFAKKSDVQDVNLSNYYTKTEIDNMEFITVNDIDVICGVSVSQMISFTVEGETYQAEEGMTWAEWINSDYNNNDKLYLDEFEGAVVFDGNGLKCKRADESKFYDYYVHPDKIIEDGDTYEKNDELF